MKNSSNEELTNKIAELLESEMDQLPPEGGNIDIRVEVQGDMVGGNKTVIINPKPEVPDNNPNRRHCPQCEKTTWSATKYCMHCGYDLFGHDAIMRREIVESRKTKFLAVFGALAIGCMFLVQYLPAGIKGWVMGVGALSGLAAMGLMNR